MCLTNWISDLFIFGFFFINCNRLINLKQDYHWPAGLCTLGIFLPMSLDCQILSPNRDLLDAFVRCVTLIDNHYTLHLVVCCKIFVFHVFSVSNSACNCWLQSRIFGLWCNSFKQSWGYCIVTQEIEGLTVFFLITEICSISAVTGSLQNIYFPFQRLN